MSQQLRVLLLMQFSIDQHFQKAETCGVPAQKKLVVPGESLNPLFLLLFGIYNQCKWNWEEVKLGLKKYWMR